MRAPWRSFQVINTRWFLAVHSHSPCVRRRGGNTPLHLPSVWPSHVNYRFHIHLLFIISVGFCKPLPTRSLNPKIPTINLGDGRMPTPTDRDYILAGSTISNLHLEVVCRSPRGGVCRYRDTGHFRLPAPIFTPLPSGAASHGWCVKFLKNVEQFGVRKTKMLGHDENDGVGKGPSQIANVGKI